MKYLWLVLLVGVIGCGEYKNPKTHEQELEEKFKHAASMKLENRRLALEEDRLQKQYQLCLKFLENQLQNKMPVNCSLGAPR